MDTPRSTATDAPDHLVIALDDDRPDLASLERLLSAHGHAVRTHDHEGDLFHAGPPDVPACLLVEYQLKNGVSGIDVRAEILRRGWNLPTIFLTANASVPQVVRAMRDGADGFLTKPYAKELLLEEIDRALARARALACESAQTNDLLARAATLTPREREIVGLVVDGHLNKEIAERLGLALVTVKVHRGSAMSKLGAGNPAELTQLAIQAGIVGDR